MARALESYVRALLVGLPVPPVRDAAPAVTRAFGDERGLHVPMAFPMYGGGRGREARFAAAAHLATHLRFGRGRFPRGSLRPIQVVLVSLFEDARVERLAARELPGLARTWASFHRATPGDHATFPALCARLSRALLEPDYQDPHPMVVKARELFFHADHDLETAQGCRRMGSLLGNDVGQTRLSFDARTYLVEPPYRDDHRLLWDDRREDGAAPESEAARETTGARPADGATPGDGARDEEPAGRAGAGTKVSAIEAADDDDGASTYPEWDYLIGLARPDWCTVREQPAGAAAPAPRAAEAPGDPALVRRLRRLAARPKREALVRRKRVRDGEAFDLDAAVEMQIDRHAGRLPELRVYRRLERSRRDLAAVLLLDVSASTGASLPGHDAAGATVLDLARRTALVLGDFLSLTGDLFAIHGFSSDGRHQVQYHRFKDLDEPWDPTATSLQLSGLAPRLSTRMGAALRHAGRLLRPVRRQRRLVLLLTDGEPSDVDAPDPAYLMHDARQAVAEQRRDGVHTFAVSLDAAGADYCRRIFGGGGYWIVERPAHLPELLPRLYARLSR